MKEKRLTVRRLMIYFLLICCLSCMENDTANVEKPNIVLIFADDFTYTAIHALGNEEIKTPNLDRMVENGTNFSHAYNMGSWSGAVCVASRSMIISGRSVWRANEIRKNWGKGDSISIDKTWGRIMEANGYETYMTGKWHVEAPAEKVFKNAIHIRPGMPGDFWQNANIGDKLSEIDNSDYAKIAAIMPKGYFRPANLGEDSWNPTDTMNGGFWSGGKHWSEVLKDDAISYINEAKNDPNPFFMYLAFNAPHDPRQAPQEFLDLYPLENISVPKSFLPDYPFKDGIGNGPSLRDEALAPFPRNEFAIKTHIQEYYALISHLDAQIGLILDALENSGKMDNTYVFFTADHGLAMGRHGLLGKQNMFDHSMRVPMMVMGPRIPRGESIGADIYLQDVMATSLDLAKIEIPEYVEFKSFLDLVHGSRKDSHYESIYGAYLGVQRMIRKDGFKLILYPKIQKVLLFDMNNDPEEMNDLSENPEYNVRKKELFNELLTLQEEYGDEMDLKDFEGLF